MKINARGGLTLIELVIATALTFVLGAMTCLAIASISRTVSMDVSVVTMDRDGDRAISQTSEILRNAILPTTLTNTVDASDFRKALNDVSKGFGQNGDDWRKVLQFGGDCIAFTVPVDYGNDGDTTDADMLTELGIILPDNTHVATGHYSGGSNNKLSGNLNHYLSELNPISHLGMPTTRGNLNLGTIRFAEQFTFPILSAPPAGYGIIRFRPRYVNNAPFLVSEASLGYDLNGDNETDDTFVLGRLEAIYPNVLIGPSHSLTTRGDPYVIPITGSNILLQTNQTDLAWTPIFKLIGYDRSSTPNAINLPDFNESTAATGDYALAIRLLMCDAEGQGNDPATFGRKTPAITRQYEAIINLRNLGGK